MTLHTDPRPLLRQGYGGQAASARRIAVLLAVVIGSLSQSQAPFVARILPQASGRSECDGVPSAGRRPGPRSARFLHTLSSLQPHHFEASRRASPQSRRRDNGSAPQEKKRSFVARILMPHHGHASNGTFSTADRYSI